MQLLSKPKLKAFQNTHRDTAKWIDAWVADVDKSTWQTPMDIKRFYPKASILPNNVFIFDVKGNQYRLEVKVDFPSQIMHVIWVGTHQEYTRRNKERG